MLIMRCGSHWSKLILMNIWFIIHFLLKMNLNPLIMILFIIMTLRERILFHYFQTFNFFITFFYYLLLLLSFLFFFLLFYWRWWEYQEDFWYLFVFNYFDCFYKLYWDGLKSFPPTKTTGKTFYYESEGINENSIDCIISLITFFFIFLFFTSHNCFFIVIFVYKIHFT